MESLGNNVGKALVIAAIVRCSTMIPFSIQGSYSSANTPLPIP